MSKEFPKFNIKKEHVVNADFLKAEIKKQMCSDCDIPVRAENNCLGCAADRVLSIIEYLTSEREEIVDSLPMIRIAGKPYRAKCPSCDEVIDAADRFCRYCGQSVKYQEE